MPLLTTAELAQMQADTAATSFDQSFTIKRSTRTADNTGHYSESWSTIVPSVNGTLSQPTPSQMQNYGYLIGALSAWQVRLPVGTNVQQNDRLVVSGQTMRVQIVLQPRSRQITLDLLATEITPEQL